jgi:hypothetical protein
MATTRIVERPSDVQHLRRYDSRISTLDTLA